MMAFLKPVDRPILSQLLDATNRCRSSTEKNRRNQWPAFAEATAWQARD